MFNKCNYVPEAFNLLILTFSSLFILQTTKAFIKCSLSKLGSVSKYDISLELTAIYYTVYIKTNLFSMHRN